MNAASIIGIVLWSLLPGFIAMRKGRSFVAYFLLSFIITPLITTIITLCLSSVNQESEKDSSTGNETADGSLTECKDTDDTSDT